MKASPGTLQAGGAAFRTTHWSVIADCGLADDEGADALAQLCSDYWPPLYSFARRRGRSPADAQDLVQGFFASFLQKKGYLQADRRKGKFRTFLLSSFKHYMANIWDHEHALKRGGNLQFVVLEEEMEAAENLYQREAGLILDEEQNYEHCWAATLITTALTRLGREFREEAKMRLFTELRPFLCGGANLPNQQEIAERLGMPVNTLRSHLSRLRARYGEVLREEVARTIGKADDVDEELRHFRKLLIKC